MDRLHFHHLFRSRWRVLMTIAWSSASYLCINCYICVNCGKASHTSPASPGYLGRGPLSEEVWRCLDCWVDFYARGLNVATARRARILTLGPSHFERKALRAAGLPFTEVTGNILEMESSSYQKQHLLGVPSLPVYNQITLHLLRRAYKVYDQVVWCVSNWFFGNKDIERLRALGKGTSEAEDLFLWSDFCAGNVQRQLITPENTELLVEHSVRCIDFILDEMPRTKLLFWCLAKRSFNRQGPSKQIPVHGQYEAMINRYQDHCLDILKYHSKESFDRICCQDRSGHPTIEGYQTISQLLDEAG